MDESAGLAERSLSFAAMPVPQSEAADAAQRILSRLAPDRFRRSDGALDLASIYETDPPRGGAHLFRLVLYSSEQLPDICVLVTNLADGWNSLSSVCQGPRPISASGQVDEGACRMADTLRPGLERR